MAEKTRSVESRKDAARGTLTSQKEGTLTGQSMDGASQRAAMEVRVPPGVKGGQLIEVHLPGA